MSMHKLPLNELETAGLTAHGLDIGKPSQLSDAFRHGVKWTMDNAILQWIPVGKRRPEKTQGNKIWATDGVTQFECEFDDGLWCNVFGNEFTHWMPLPAVPEQNK